MLTTVSAFLGAFAALIVMNEIQAYPPGDVGSKAKRYLGGLLLGAILAVLLGMVLNWCAKMLGAAT